MEKISQETKQPNNKLSHGTFVEYKNDTLYSITVINNGKRDSTWTYYHPNGNVESTIEYDNNKPNGYKKYYSKTSKLYYKAYYENGELVSDTIYDKNLYNYKFNLYKHGKAYYKKCSSCRKMLDSSLSKIRAHLDTTFKYQYTKDAVIHYIIVEKQKKFYKKAKRLRRIKKKSKVV